MLSRRNIRIKIMQLLYAKRLDEVLTYDDLKKRFSFLVEQSYELYLFSVLQLVKIAKVSQEEAARRSSKHLPTDEDLKFTAKLYENDVLASLSDNASFNKILKNKHLDAKVDTDMSRLFYNEYSKTEEYTQYVNGESEESEHREALLSLYKYCINSESYNDYLEEKFDNWIHDRSLVIGAMKKTLKGLPQDEFFYKAYLPTDETIKDFGEELLYKVNFFDEDLLTIIKPALKNWEADRVAIIDLILLKLALAEMMYFPTIPVKVTINEFVDISKLYSTPKSKDFINGILDRLMKKLTKDGKINKEGRGLID